MNAMLRTFRLMLLAAVASGLTAPANAQIEILHEEKSLYRNILVKQNRNHRCLVFSVRRADRNQSCMDVRYPELIVFPYVKMVFAGLLVHPNPERFLVVGLGAGTIPDAFEVLYPDATVDVVEIDPAVDRVAREYFDYKEGPDTTVAIADARVFIRRAGLRGKRYDVIVLDAFTGDYIPEHLMTVEFLNETAALLTAAALGGAPLARPRVAACAAVCALAATRGGRCAAPVRLSKVTTNEKTISVSALRISCCS